VNNVKNFLDEVNKLSPVEGLKEYKKSGFDLNNQLNDLKKFVEALERNGKMCHCLEEFDKEALKSSSWQFALKKYVLPDLANYEKQVTFISVHLKNNFCADAGELEENDNGLQAFEDYSLLHAQSVPVQLKDVRFPYMFTFLTADKFRTFKSTLMPKPSMDSHASR